MAASIYGLPARYSVRSSFHVSWAFHILWIIKCYRKDNIASLLSESCRAILVACVLFTVHSRLIELYCSSPVWVKQLQHCTHAFNLNICKVRMFQIKRWQIFLLCNWPNTNSCISSTKTTRHTRVHFSVNVSCKWHKKMFTFQVTIRFCKM